jgi:hypothetical protein
MPGLPTQRYKALMTARITAGGSVLVECPYCLVFWRLHNDVDVTRFVDRDGKREVTCYCLKGHKLAFRQVNEWREERQRAGIQVRP